MLCWTNWFNRSGQYPRALKSTSERTERRGEIECSAAHQFPVKCRCSKWTPRKAIAQLVATYVAATTTSFFTNESSSFEQISTRRPKISPVRPMATSIMKKTSRNNLCVIISSNSQRPAIFLVTLSDENQCSMAAIVMVHLQLSR
jgi:hypothetical protein